MAIIGGIGGYPQMKGNITPESVLSGFSGYAADPRNKIEGAIQSLGAREITPSGTQQVIPAGIYLSGAQTILPIPDTYGKVAYNSTFVGNTTKTLTIEFEPKFIPSTILLSGGAGPESSGVSSCVMTVWRSEIMEAGITTGFYLLSNGKIYGLEGGASQTNIVNATLSNGIVMLSSPNLYFFGTYYCFVAAFD